MEQYSLNYQPQTASYADFWRRMVAAALDQSIVFIVSYALIMAFVMAGTTSQRASFLSALLGFVVLVLNWAYFAIMESSRSQATLGKRLLGLQVVSKQGQPISLARATGRFFARGFFQGIRYMVPGWRMANRDFMVSSMARFTI